MARPNKPGYFAARNCWRFQLLDRRIYFCKGVRPDQKPQREGVPRIVWDEMDRMIRAATLDAAPRGAEPTVRYLFAWYEDWLGAEVEAGRQVRKNLQNFQAHRSLWNAIMEDRHSLPASQLSPDDMDDFFAQLASARLPRTNRPPSGHYVHTIAKNLRTMYRWAARPIKGRSPVRLIPSNPFDGYKFPGQPGAVRGYVEAKVVRRFLRWAWSEARWASMDRRSESDGPRPLKPTVDVERSLKRRFDRIYLLMLRFQRLTGCRPGEACRLQWSEVAESAAPTPEGARPRRKFEGGVITISPDRVKTRKQTSKARRIYVTAPVARLLRAIDSLEGRHPTWVFPHMRARNAGRLGEHDALAGQPWPDGSAASAPLTKLRERAIAAGIAGIEKVGPTKLVAYANRHGFASEASSLGYSDEQVAEQLGNSPEVMRRTYAHTLDDAAAARAAEISEGRRGGVRRGAKG